MSDDNLMARDALERWISSQLPACSHDELRVIAIRLERMCKARDTYGPLDLASDQRDFVREAAEENIDRAFYRDALYVKRQDEERAELRAASARELAAAPIILGSDPRLAHVKQYGDVPLPERPGNRDKGEV